VIAARRPTPSDARPRRVTKRRAETRQRLLDAAMDVFAEQGFGRTSVEDVCARAGYTRGAFYSNFVSLDELFLAMWQQRTDAMLEAAAAALETAEEHPVTSLEEGIDRFLEVVVVDDHWYRIEAEFTAHALRVSGLREVMADREARIAGLLLPYLDRALAHVGRRILDRDTFAAALVAVHDGTAPQCLIEPDQSLARERRRNLFLAVVDAYTEVNPHAQP
jgi:AcrR family transcriptional regulator